MPAAPEDVELLLSEDALLDALEGVELALLDEVALALAAAAADRACCSNASRFSVSFLRPASRQVFCCSAVNFQADRISTFAWLYGSSRLAIITWQDRQRYRSQGKLKRIARLSRDLHARDRVSQFRVKTALGRRGSQLARVWRGRGVLSYPLGKSTRTSEKARDHSAFS